MFQRQPSEPDREQLIEKILAMRAEAVSLANIHDHSGAFKILNEAERICRELKHSTVLAIILHEKAITLSTAGNPAEALKVVSEAEQLCNIIGDWGQLYDILRSKCVFFDKIGDKEGETRTREEMNQLLTEWLQSARQGNNPRELVDVLVLFALSQHPTVNLNTKSKKKLLEEAFQVARRYDLQDMVRRITQIMRMLSMLD